MTREEGNHWCWTLDPECDEGWRGPCDTKDQAISKAKAEAFGQPVTVSKCYYPEPDRFVDASNLLEQTCDCASDNGCYSDNDTVFEWKTSEKEAHAELESWAKKHLKAKYFNVDHDYTEMIGEEK